MRMWSLKEGRTESSLQIVPCQQQQSTSLNSRPPRSPLASAGGYVKGRKGVIMPLSPSPTSPSAPAPLSTKSHRAHGRAQTNSQLRKAKTNPLPFPHPFPWTILTACHLLRETLTPSQLTPPCRTPATPHHLAGTGLQAGAAATQTGAFTPSLLWRIETIAFAPSPPPATPYSWRPLKVKRTAQPQYTLDTRTSTGPLTNRTSLTCGCCPSIHGFMA